MNCINLFSTTIYQKFCNLDTDKIANLCYEHKKNSPSVYKSNIGGYQGDGFICEDLHTEILQSIPVLENKPITDISINMWVNINKQFDYNTIHNHAPFNGVILSGVYYIKCPEKCGNIKFFDPRFFITTSLDMQYYNDANIYWHFEPHDNMMLIFPSWLHHSVDSNESSQDRISVAFNISWKF